MTRSHVLAVGLITAGVLSFPIWTLIRNLTQESPDSSALGYVVAFLLGSAFALACSSSSIVLTMRQARPIARAFLIATIAVVAYEVAGRLADRHDAAWPAIVTVLAGGAMAGAVASPWPMRSRRRQPDMAQ